MLDKGLVEVPNPSEMLLSGRPTGTPGTCVTCVMEGVRPVLAEVQALVAPSGFASPRRTSNGVDYNRAMLLLAVLEKRGGFNVGGHDAYINVIGGLSLGEPAADLATILAVASSMSGRPVPDRAGGHRGSGTDRRAADGERPGSAVGRGASAGVHPVYAAGAEQSEAAGAAGAATDSRQEHPRGAGLAAERDLTARC